MKRVFCLVGSCLLGMVFILSIYNWFTNFGTNIELVIVSFILFVVLLGYTVYDVLSVVDDLNFYRDKCAELEEAIVILKDRIEEYEFEVNMLREEIRRLEDYDREEAVNPTNRT